MIFVVQTSVDGKGDFRFFEACLSQMGKTFDGKQENG